MVLHSSRTPWGAPVFYIKETTSTMDEARLLEEQGSPSGTAVAAGHQSTGRGRFSDRPWEGGRDENLLFTLFLADRDIAATQMALSLRLSLGLALYLESLGLNPQIKWPNDILVTGRKIAGILVIKRRHSHHIGIGLNVLQKIFPRHFRVSPTSLVLEGIPKSPLEHLDALLPTLKAVLDRGLESEAEVHSQVTGRLWALNAPLVLRPDAGRTEVSGVFRGIGSCGQALLETDGRIREYFSGES